MKKTLIVLVLAIATMVSYSQSIEEVRIDLSNDSITELSRVAEASGFFIAWGVKGAELDTNAQVLYVYYNRAVLKPDGKTYTFKDVVLELKKGSDEFNLFVSAYSSAFTPLIEAIIKKNEGIE